MGYSFMHLPTAEIACCLDEHGGDKERRHAELAERFDRELSKAIFAIAGKPEYAEIISYTSFARA